MGIAILVALVLLALGVPIFTVFLLLAALGGIESARGFGQEFGGGVQSLFALGTSPITAPILSTIPLFILAGFIMAESRTADRTVRVAQAALGWLPGGLAVCTILACAVFTTFTGASGVTIVALGGLLMPALLKEQYPERFSLGLLAGTGSVGLLFPPAVPLFVYGTIYGVVEQSRRATEAGDMKLIEFSTDRFVFAGIVPGLVLIGMLSLYAVFVAVKRGVPTEPFDARALRKSLIIALPELLIPFLIIIGLLKGLQLPQLASLCVVYVLAIEMLLYRDLPLARLWKVVRASMGLAGAIFAIVLTAQAFTSYLVTARVPQLIVDWILAHFEAKWAFLLALNVMLLVVGMVMDIFSAIVVVVPLIAPAAVKMGVDPFHLGVIFLLNLEVGYLHPPVGLNLFITSFTFRKPILEVTIAALPPLCIMIAALLVVTYVEPLTVVPERERRGRATELARQVREEYQRAGSVKELTGPDGTVLKMSDCGALPDDLRRKTCTGLFADVTECRRKAGGRAGSECESKAIAEYVQQAKEDQGAADDDWSDADEGADAKKAGGTPK
ncbi:MAG TPA: TRAP transporter large permease [Candidatus Acidoferrum sp.]|nr:TRAP transporter large permease [Candidatus Acidoferrum sp.]